MSTAAPPVRRRPVDYLLPEVIQAVGRLDLKARFIVGGFLSGLHASPVHGLSVEFSEHRRYSPGDDPDDIDWIAYAKTDRYYIKKFQAETNLTGHLLLDLSASMGFTHRQAMTKFEYAVCLAAALSLLMVRQQDPVGLITFDTAVRSSMPPRGGRGHWAELIGRLAEAEPTGATDVAGSLRNAAAAIRGRGLVAIFSDLLADPDETLEGVRRLRHSGHDVIVFHVLDEAEVEFPLKGMTELTDPETGAKQTVDAAAIRDDYVETLNEFLAALERGCRLSGADYLPLHTGMRFDTALVKYLSRRQARF
ncbi:MAG: DUF58 domain-containing protein [Planctomycetota bacterium]